LTIAKKQSALNLVVRINETPISKVKRIEISKLNYPTPKAVGYPVRQREINIIKAAGFETGRFYLLLFFGGNFY
jgi:hypothetical protein